ncbi:MAG: 16S rRNA (cytidine(1402)-2'-O)-methyltransferase [Stellaceae bacterium]
MRREPSDRARRSKPAGETAPSGLYLVATPIGHAQDLTLRARDLLGRVDAVACEDTRVTAKLLALHDIRAPLLPYHEHNAERMRPRLLARLNDGGAIALVSDAGMPLVSDPGYKLVRAAIADGIQVTVVPGPSAPLAALLLSGLPPDRFFFAGFLPAKATARRETLAELAAIPATLIWFESGPRLAASLADAAEILGDRPAAVARELTKLHEEVRRGPLAELWAHYRDAGPPKGEIVVVAGPPEPAAPLEDYEIDRRLAAALADRGVAAAAAAVAADSGLPRRRLYARALALKEKTG